MSRCHPQPGMPFAQSTHSIRVDCAIGADLRAKRLAFGWAAVPKRRGCPAGHKSPCTRGAGSRAVRAHYAVGANGPARACRWRHRHDRQRPQLARSVVTTAAEITVITTATASSRALNTSRSSEAGSHRPAISQPIQR